jgi:small conductance mechanosensitive channel
MVNPMDFLGFSTVSDVIVKLIAALAIVLFGLILGNLFSKLLKKVLHGFELNRVLKDQGIKFPLEEFLSSILKYIVYFIGIIWALTELGLATVVLEIVLIVILILVVIFIILAFKDFIPNITAGFFIHHKNLFKKGDHIRVKSIDGVIQEVDLIETKVRTVDGDVILVPNSILTKSEVIKVKKRK